MNGDCGEQIDVFLKLRPKRKGKVQSDLALIPRSFHQLQTLNFRNTLLNEAATPHRYLWSFNLPSPAVTAGNQDQAKRFRLNRTSCCTALAPSRTHHPPPPSPTARHQNELYGFANERRRQALCVKPPRHRHPALAAAGTNPGIGPGPFRRRGGDPPKPPPRQAPAEPDLHPPGPIA